MHFKKEALLDLLPYGGSFLFLDEVSVDEKVDINGSFAGEGFYKIPNPEESRIMADHFPGCPVFPGHLKMEAVAQLAAVIFIAKQSGDDSVLPVLTQSSFELKTMAIPGDTLLLKATICVKGRAIEVVGEIICGANTSSGMIKGIAMPKGIFGRMAKRKEKKEQLNQTVLNL